MGIETIIGIGLKLFGFFFGLAKNKDEQHKWMVRTAEALHEKNLLTARQLLELEKAQSDYIDSKLDSLSIRAAAEADTDRPDAAKDAPGLMYYSQRKEFKEPKIEVLYGMKAPGKMVFQTSSKKPMGMLVHYTAGAADEDSNRDAKGTMRSLLKRGLGCVVLDQDGTFYVPEGWDILKHWDSNAGRSEWLGVKSVSRKVVGVEVVCPGKLTRVGNDYYAWFDVEDGKVKPGRKPWPHPRIVGRKDNMRAGAYAPFTPEQEEALFDLAAYLKRTCPEFKVSWCFGHDECATPLGRKSDPGGSFSMTMPEFRKKLRELL